MTNSTRRWAEDRAQVTMLSLVVIFVALALILALALIGQAMVERQAATIAADAVALASTHPGEADAIADWYRDQGIAVSHGPGWAEAAGERAHARSRAERDREPQVAPALVAIIARAGQLVGRSLAPVAAEGMVVTFAEADSAEFARAAGLLSMCRVDTIAEGTRWTRC